MKKFGIIAIWVVATTAMISCNQVRRSPGRAYMPDMAYSRAYETYASTENLKQKGIHYTGQPVAGTIAKGDMPWVYPYKNDSAGYANSANVTNPLPPLDAKDYLEASRLYLVNCGICHGEKLDGNGPLWNGGNGPFTAAPRNLVTDPVALNLKEGTMFHSITYGKNLMGGHASQLSTKQRWMIVHYIKEKQATAAPAAGTGKAPAPAKDSTAKK
ncbi:MAG TPA: c-type cytochrome [Chitinophagaceae bacterium]|nr:c-type cytochrome [Chitinophagaceae bacterium]